ncbi:MAG: T9SS type A sorting domain-containing protein, partial [Ignavibacteriae bacterium]|nr:T9SS type A sorting domain-containing protein [Ignavibacteriota bacterium]
QNYPNPFNPVTKISYQIPSPGLVTLRIYDVLGREVRTLVNKELNSGKYEIEFNASSLSSGIYFYTLSAGSFLLTKKLMLLK